MLCNDYVIIFLMFLFYGVNKKSEYRNYFVRLNNIVFWGILIYEILISCEVDERS